MTAALTVAKAGNPHLLQTSPIAYIVITVFMFAVGLPLLQLAFNRATGRAAGPIPISCRLLLSFIVPAMACA